MPSGPEPQRQTTTKRPAAEPAPHFGFTLSAALKVQHIVISSIDDELSEPLPMINPFQYGAELKPAQLVNRKPELRDVTRTLLEHGRLFLIGPRRHGKTAILHAACLVARRADAVVLSLDA